MIYSTILALHVGLVLHGRSVSSFLVPTTGKAMRHVASVKSWRPPVSPKNQLRDYPNERIALTLTCLLASTDDSEKTGDNSRIRKKRVRRKTAPLTEATTTTSFAPPPTDTPVKIAVQDVRDLVGRSGDDASSSSAAASSKSGKSGFNSSASVGTSPRSQGDDDDDPLARLLTDARAMQNAGDSAPEAAAAGGVVPVLQKMISTVVTVDFFVVCALLLWFLSGIFCSYIIKDDTVQIAFNNIFEPVVQPALGVLMIASLSDAVLKGDEDEFAQ